MISLRLTARSAPRLRFASAVASALLAVCLDTAPLHAQTPTSAGPVDPAFIEDLVAANRILVAQGIVDAYGHVSVRHPRDPNRFLLSRSLAPGLVTADDLIEYDLDGVAVDLRGRAEYSERYIHAEIYRARPDVNSVVHNHSPSVIPFGISSVPIRPVYHMAGFIGAGLPVFDIRERFGMTDMLVSDAERGRELAHRLEGHPAVLMRGHGVSVVGPSISFAVARSVYLEINARIQLEAIGLGGEVTYLDPAEARHVLDAGENRGYTRPWEIWKREALGTP